MKKEVIFTGGGSGGHVVPAIVLIKKLLELEVCTVRYIGGVDGIERSLTSSLPISYHPISSGKLRRYFSINNLFDLFKIIYGILQAFLIFAKFRKKSVLLVSMGGFVSVPAVIAAWIMRKQIFIHEQTARAGLANRIGSLFANKIFLTFEESRVFFPEMKSVVSGLPMRDAVYASDVKRVELDGVLLNDVDRPILFVTGGGNGSRLLNNLIKNLLQELTRDYFIVHQVGRGHIDAHRSFRGESYIPVALLGEEIIDIYKLSAVVISRAGANTVNELIELKKRSIFIPLKIAQKNEQYHNAMNANAIVGSIVLDEDGLTEAKLLMSIKEVQEKSQQSGGERVGPRASEMIISHIQKLL